MNEPVSTTTADKQITTSDIPTVKVGSNSPTQSVAGTIARHLQGKGSEVQVRAIGAGAVNQAVKACAVARGFVAQRGMDLILRPGFATVQGDINDEASAIVLNVIAV